MSETPDPLRDLEERVRKARGKGRVRDQDAPPSKLGLAFRLSTELVAAVVVGGAFGWGLDRLFGTAPFLMIVMFFLGVAAGFRNVVRAAREMSEDQQPKG